MSHMAVSWYHHAFLLQNVERNSPECIGMDGLLDAYRDALRVIELAGPTEFGPTLRHAARQAAALPQDGSKYSVLLIITDGVINDMNRAKEEIVKVCFWWPKFQFCVKVFFFFSLQCSHSLYSEKFERIKMLSIQ